MKKFYLYLFLLPFYFFSSTKSVFAQPVVCPSLTLPGTTLSCSTPCATLNATPSTTFAATTSYAVSSVTYAPSPYGTGTQPTFAGSIWSSSTDDSYGDLIPLPFHFCFFGNTYSAIVIGTNGNINFNTTGASSLVNAYDPYSISGPLPGSNCTATENAIMGVWNDTYVGGGWIYYNTYGTAPCRKFVVSWNNVDLFLPGTYCDGNTCTSQIVLYEASNIIDIYIGNRQPCTDWNSGYAVCGIENNAGTVFYCPPGENGTTFSATNQGWRFTPTGAVSGWTYSWTGPGGAIPGTTSSVVVCPSVTSTYTVTATSGACVGVTISTTATVVTTGSTTPITGTATVCVGGTTTLVDATPGGVWSSGTPGVATVSATGVVTGIAGGTSVISYTVSGCTSVLTVTVSPTPAITGITSLCVGATSTLTDAVPGGTWSSSAPGIASIGATTGILTGVASGTCTITYTSPAGCTATTTANVIVIAPISGTTVVCQGATTTLADGAGGGTWTSSNTAIATIDPSTGVVTGVSGGVVTITYAGGSGCQTTTSLTVNPMAPITGTLSMCVGFGVTLSDAVTGGVWSSGSPLVASIDPVSGVVSGLTGGTSIITYTAPGGCVTTTTVTVINVAPIGGALAVCMGNTIVLTDATPGGVWSSSNPGIASIGAATGVVTGISGGTTTITYLVAGMCQSTAIVTVNPVSPITGTMSMCLNYTTTLNNILTGGTWSSSNTSIATIDNTTGVVLGVGAGTATISYTLPTGCLMITVVTVNPKPAQPIPNPDTYCQFASAVAVSASGTGLTWYGPGITPGMSSAPVPSTLVAGTINYYVTQTSAFGCVSDSATDVVTIKPQPTAPITEDTSYCQFYSGNIIPLNFEVDSLSGSILNWYSFTGSSLPTAPVPTTAVNNYPTGTTWYVSQTVNGCESPKAPVKVVIVPTPQFNVIDQNWVCVHDSILLSFVVSSGSGLLSPLYYWHLPIGATVVNGTSTSDSAIYVKFDSSGNLYYHGYLTIGNLSGECSNTDSFKVKVIPAPTTVGYTNPDVCLNDTVSLELTAHTLNAFNYFWYVDGTALTTSNAVNIVAAASGSGGPYKISWINSGTHIIKILCSTVEGCMSLPVYDTVKVHDLPDASFDFKPNVNGAFCLEDSILFTARYNDNSYTYLWQPAHYFNNNSKSSIWGKVEIRGGDVQLTVIDEFGCIGTYSKEIDPSTCCTVSFPTAFTPNGDGRNDLYRPVFSGFHRFHIFRIMNRWGQVVFETTNSQPEWDGNYGGVPQDIGTYFCYIKYDCGDKTIEQKGDCTLIR